MTCHGVTSADKGISGDSEAVASHDGALESPGRWRNVAADSCSPTCSPTCTKDTAATVPAKGEAVDAPATPAPHKRKQSSKASRAVALELYNLHTPMPVITQRTGIKSGAFYALIRRATQRGFTRGSRVLDEHVVDAYRSGRPQTAERGRDGKRKRTRPTKETTNVAGPD